MPDVTRQIMNNLRRIVHALRSSHRAAGDLNLTGAQLFVMNVLADADGPLSVKDIAERTRTDQSTVSVVVARLVDRGLVSKKQSTIDTRRAELLLTSRGRNLQKKAPATIGQQRLTAALERFRPRDARAFLRYLDEIVEAMQISGEPAEMLFDDEQRVGRRRAAPTRRKSSRST